MGRLTCSSCLRGLLVTCLLSAALVVTLAGCPQVVPPGPDGGPGELPEKASDWVSFVNWDEATRVEVIGKEDGDHFFFDPADLTFEAGKPYILTMSSPASNGAKHYFHSPDFYKAIATRKAQTAEAEYKAPYFDDFELLIGGSIELYFVPVIAGTYEMWCTIEGHREAGMEGTWTITGGEGYELDLEVAEDFNTALMTDDRRSGSHDVWQEGNLATQTVTLTEYQFTPNEFTLTTDVGYKLSLVAPATNEEKHYHTAVELYKTVVTRKAQDSQAEIKVPYFKAVELLAGGSEHSTDLYIVPTVPSSYELICTVPGHADLGMTGTITVVDKASLPTKASDWVGFVDWDEAPRITITSHEHVPTGGENGHDEEGGSDEETDTDHEHGHDETGDADQQGGDGEVLEDFMYHPDSPTTLEAGKPYIFEFSNFESNEYMHYFNAPEFYRAVAARKAQTSDAEYKAPYFEAFELMVGGTLDFYFVPVIPGTYEMWCTNSGHRDAGLLLEISVTGGAGYELDLEVADDFDMALATDERRSGDDPVWQDGNLRTQTVTLAEYQFTPNEFTLTKDVGYKLNLVAPATNEEKHYHTAAELYKTVVTRKGQDSQAEIKVPYFKAVELLIGGSADLYIVPTIAGAYESICTVPGHFDLGMTGTITVE